MYIHKYLGITYDNNGFSNAIKLDEIFSKHTKLDIRSYFVRMDFMNLLAEQPISTIMNFINMFRDADEKDPLDVGTGYTLPENMLLLVYNMSYDKKKIYMIFDHMQKLDMCTCYDISSAFMIYDIKKQTKIVEYMLDNHNIIQHVRKLINNYNMILFKINNDVWLINLFLLICKCKQKNLPKFIILYKILYYYLLYQNYEYN